VEKLPVSISAETDCAILFLDKKRILGGSAEFCTRLSMNLLKIVARRNLFLNGKLSILSRKTTAEKIMAYLQQQSKICGSKEFEIPFDRQSLADFLGVERSAMSAEINRLKKSGRIDTRKNWFRVE
jgi:CRP-like cAMP-binding protein